MFQKVEHQNDVGEKYLETLRSALGGSLASNRRAGEDNKILIAI